MAWQHWFLPHKDTHKKAHLLSWEAVLVYVLFFIFLQVSFSIVGFAKPGVLGINANIDQKKLIELTNIERQKAGLSVLVESEALNKAAKLKGENMFEENYWAHFAPSGKSPWDFILGAGYKFTYAGENLAKNFYSPDEVVAAWMASQTHKDNLLNNKYKDIGIAVVEGILNGQKTTLIVQEFGTTEILASSPVVEVQGKQIAVPTRDLINKPELVAGSEARIVPAKSIIDPFIFTKSLGISLIVFIGALLALDLLVLYRRGVLRIGSHHIAHMSILSISAVSLLTSGPGVIL
ncbi:hypothetical protein HYW43_00555 [Candidatus Daviesbacteria bacterium]|nr:hypothetical protein [Candidatus Daviesbacteria bacterium]